MDLEVVGRHALFFDDDSLAAFVNSPAALVEWNSLSIDRYDVRHLLSAPPPPRKRRSHQSTPPRSESLALEAELDHERFLDLPPPIEEEEEEPNVGSGSKQGTTGAYNAVGFSYGNADDSANQKMVDTNSNFRPPFPVPEGLRQNLPPTEKIHQIIARTATFVSKNGGQSEIVLRVKQGDNPTFGFLMPDHHLYPYYRFLVDHHELLITETNKKTSEDVSGPGQAGGALSLLGSAYDSGEDEDINGPTPKSEETKSLEASDGANMSISHGSENTVSSNVVAVKVGSFCKHRLSSLKEKASLIRKNNSLYSLNGGAKDGEPSTAGSAVDKSKFPAISSLKVEQSVLEPPSDLKRSVDKIVEFILKNGKEFESILREQDREHGRFPFLLPYDQYHSYYLQVLEKAQQSKLPMKKMSSGKHDAIEKKSSAAKESDGLPLDSDIPYDSYRKGKFKMVIGKTKKDDQEQPSKDTQLQIGVGVDAAAAAAILQAARRGIKNPTLDILPGTASFNGSGQGLCGEAGTASSFGSLSVQKLDQNAPLSATFAKTAALAAAGEADSSEASLTKEQKLKAERLRRAKMFTAMLKKGSEPLKSGNLSGEPSGSMLSGSGAVNVNLSGGKKESSPVVSEVDTLDRSEKIETKASDDEKNERRAKRRYRSRSRKDVEDDEEEQEVGDKYREKDHKHLKKKRRSHRSSHRSKDRHKHRKRHRHDGSEDEHWHHRHQHEHDSSSNDERYHHRYKHDDHSSDYEERRRRRRHKHHDSSDSDHDLEKSDERRERVYKEELEEGEISAKSGESKASGAESAKREASVDISNSSQAQSRGDPSQPTVTTEVSDDLRAKIRAMLMATL